VSKATEVFGVNDEIEEHSTSLALDRGPTENEDIDVSAVIATLQTSVENSAD
jgi:hypothetical protein